MYRAKIPTCSQLENDIISKKTNEKNVSGKKDKKNIKAKKSKQLTTTQTSQSREVTMVSFLILNIILISWIKIF